MSGPGKGKGKLESAMAGRSPLGMRQAIEPVNILAVTPDTQEAEKDQQTSPVSADTTTSTPPHRPSDRVQERTEKLSEKTVRKKRSILADTKRETERYSFEIYADQKVTIEELRALYRQRTGKPLSVSRVIREALDYFLPAAIKEFRE